MLTTVGSAGQKSSKQGRRDARLTELQAHANAKTKGFLAKRPSREHKYLDICNSTLRPLWRSSWGRTGNEFAGERALLLS